MRTAAALCAAGLTLAACGRAPQPQPQAQPQTTSDVAAAAQSPAPAPSPGVSGAPAPASTAAPALMPEADKGEKGARNVLLAWAHALEQGDFDGAYAQWGAEAQARSGMEATEHRQWWARFKTITVAAPAGQMGGAAGSSYYTVPVSIVGKQRNGKPYRLEGSVTLRRVNDVPGATPDQLHWHLEKVELHPLT